MRALGSRSSRLARALVIGVGGAAAAIGAITVGCGQISNVIDAGGDVGLVQATTYDGYLENFQLPSGSDRIRITLATPGNGAAYGNVIFGDGPLLAPPTDPNLGYPPGLGADASYGRQTIEGFAFTILDGTVQGSRIQFVLQPNELWKSWCELQTAYSNGRCNPSWPFYYDCSDAGIQGCCFGAPDGGRTPVDCQKYELCDFGSPCACVGSCTVDMDPTKAPVSFDLQLSNGHLDGTISLASVHAIAQ